MSLWNITSNELIFKTEILVVFFVLLKFYQKQSPFELSSFLFKINTSI